MSAYHHDREFTNYVHQKLALPNIYAPMQWMPVPMQLRRATEIDINKGVDYVFKFQDQYFSVQERFRESAYQSFQDFTIRYRRDQNKHSDRVLSEYFKLKAQYFLYGITNGNKDSLQTNTAFTKWALIDTDALYKNIENGKIRIVDTGSRSSKIIEDYIECPIKHNKDGSSSFVVIDIEQMRSLWGDRIVIESFGFNKSL